MLLLAAFLFGAAHAFTPGHGKTLVAAYLVGERGTVGHAVILAVATTVAHTGSVIAVAAVLWGVYGDDVPAATQGVLQFVGGLLVAAVGRGCCCAGSTGQADHFHLFAGITTITTARPLAHHGRHPPPPAAGGKAKTPLGWGRLVLMGLGGGLVPCWDAVLLLVAAGAMGRLGFALPLLFRVQPRARGGAGPARRRGTCRPPGRADAVQGQPVVPAAAGGERGAWIGVGFWLCKAIGKAIVQRRLTLAECITGAI